MARQFRRAFGNMSLTIAGWFSIWAEEILQQVPVLRRRPAILMAPAFSPNSEESRDFIPTCRKIFRQRIS
jgi:hypothetical protein